MNAEPSAPQLAAPVPGGETTTVTGSSLAYDPDRPDRDCDDFSSQEEAQALYEAAGPGDPHGLDCEGDGVACESLH